MSTNQPTLKRAARLERSYSRAMLERSIELQSVNIQKVFRRSAEYATNGLFNLEAVIPLVSDDKESVTTLLQQVGTLIQTVLEEFSNSSTQYSALMTDNGIESTIQYTDSNKVVFKLYSPLAGHLVSVFIEADKLITQIDTLWMAGIIDAIQRKDATYQVQQRLSRLCGRVGGLGESARRSVRKVEGVESEGDDKLLDQDASQLDADALEASSEAIKTAVA